MPRDYTDDEARWSALMRQSQSGDAACYAQLLSELGDVIEAFLRARFGSTHFVEDCVQESLLALHQARHSYDPSRPFRPWLFAVVRHKTIDVLRARRETPGTQSAEIGGDDQANPNETAMEGTWLLRRLRPSHREALTLTKLIGMTVAEAAARVGISEGAMKVRIHRALTATRKLMEADSP
jgi:RNA polymerase sigma-70 factor (ECF subfamily)